MTQTEECRRPFGAHHAPSETERQGLEEGKRDGEANPKKNGVGEPDLARPNKEGTVTYKRCLRPRNHELRHRKSELNTYAIARNTDAADTVESRQVTHTLSYLHTYLLALTRSYYFSNQSSSRLPGFEQGEIFFIPDQIPR